MAESNGLAAPDVLTSRKASTDVPTRDGEDELVEWVESLFSEAEQGRDEQANPSTWDTWLDTYWGDHWAGSDLPSFKAPIVVNELKSLVLQELSDLTDSRIKIYLQKDRTKPDRDVNAEKGMQSFWARNFCDLTVLEAALDAMIYPCGFLQRGWDPTAARGQGDVVLRARNPRTVYPDPDATGEDDCRYWILEDVFDLIEIRRKWPETGIAVNAEAAYSTKVDDRGGRPTPRAGAGYQGPLYAPGGGGVVEGYKKARARVLTCIVDDDEKLEEIHEIEGELKGVVRMKYPDRRMIQIANRRVLYDGNNPYQYAPIITRVLMQPSTHAFWPASSVVGEFAQIQIASNKAESMVVENGLRLNAGELFADADSGIDPNTYAAIPGTAHLIKPGSRVEKKYPPPMPDDMVQMGERLRGFIRSTMGFPLARTGAGTHGNISAELSETEISQSMGLTRLRGRLMYQSVQRAVEMVFATMAQFYTTPRHLPYMNGNKWEAVPWEPVTNPDAYAAHVDQSSFQVRSKTMMQRLYLTLAKLGKMPTEDLLKVLEIPDADEVAKRLKDELTLMAMANMRTKRTKK